MPRSDLQYAQNVRQTLRKENFSSTHYYFFEVKIANNGSKYIVIDQKRKVPGDFADTKIRIFADELLGIQHLTNKMIDLALHNDLS